jgi:hypothetical protein
LIEDDGLTSQDPPIREGTPEAGSEPTVVRLQRRRDSQIAAPDVEMHETVRGSKPGSRFLRLTRRSEQKLRRVGEAEFEATEVVPRKGHALAGCSRAYGTSSSALPWPPRRSPTNG